MKAEFHNVSILGGGLLGGSLALALEARGVARFVRLWARKQGTVSEARSLGIANATHHLSEAVADADLVILCVPVGAMPGLIAASLAAGLPNGCLITDVGSVKRSPHAAIAPLLEETGCRFIGSHPMAGSERNGLSAVSASLFEGAACLLTNDDGAPETLATALEGFWQSIGCRTAWMDAAGHDELVARISHLPHLIAASGARVCLRNPGDGIFGGGGLRDTTRVAAGNPEMWAEIVTENREAIIGPLRETIADLSEILACLEKADQELARVWLQTAKQRRDSIQPVRPT
jgi:prephenate dehydrogenase